MPCTLVLEWVLQPKLASDKEQVGAILAVYTADDDCSLVTHAFDAMMLWNLTLYTSPWTL